METRWLLTAVPLLLVLGAYAPEAVQEQFTTSVAAVFGLMGQAKAQVEENAFTPPDDDLRQVMGVVDGMMELLSATAVSRAVQQLCRRTRLMSRSEAKVAPWRWSTWIVVWLCALGRSRVGVGSCRTDSGRSVHSSASSPRAPIET